MTSEEQQHEDRYALPSAQILNEANSLFVLDAAGNKTTFKSLIEDVDTDRHLIIFIRHFFCRLCEDYVITLASQLPPETLASTTPTTTISVIGCGQPSFIPEYIQRTSSAFRIYTDPSRALYLKLGMTSNLAMGSHKPEYMQQSLVGVIGAGMWNVLRSGKKAIMGEGGNQSQNGGEWLWEKKAGGEWELQWCKRMRHTRDHAEVKELKTVLGMV